MDITSQTHHFDVVVIGLTGRLDVVEAGSVRTILTDHIEADRHRLIVDLSAIEFVDSAGLAALVQGMKRCRQGGGDLRLVTPTDHATSRVFELTKFDRVFIMGDSAEELLGGW